MKTQNSQKQGLIQRFQVLWNTKRSLVLGVAAVFLITVLSLFGQSNMFKSSLLESSNPFNGTIYPIDKSPNYLTWKGSVKADLFDSIASKDLVSLPDYSLALKDVPAAQLDKNPDVKNAKLTYPVVYLGGYDGSQVEGSGSHLAVDIRVPKGTPVRSIANGTVIKSDNGSSGFGHHLCIRHSGVPAYQDASKKVNLISCYNHLDQIKVENGAFVFKGDIIATSGNTGTSTTPHLHFQIDSDDAPWHPYWPFTMAEASSASLSFFDAVTTGLGKDKAAQLTVDPLVWIKQTYSENGMSQFVASADNSRLQTTTPATSTTTVGQFTNFEITADKDTFATDESVNLTIIAKDESGNTVKDFKPSSDFVISSTSSSAQFKKVINFVKGQSKLSVKNEVAENFEIKIQQGSVQKSFLLIAKAPEVVVETPVEETTHGSAENSELGTQSSENTENSGSSQSQTIEQVVFSGESAMMKGQSLIFYAELKDADGAAITQLSSPVQIQVDGKGTVDPENLQTSDIQSGKAVLRYSSNDVETAKISIAGQAYEIRVIDEVKSASAFRVFAANEPLPAGESSELVIQAIDSDGNDVVSFLPFGEMKMSFEEGTGSIDPEKLTERDFEGGKATVSVTPASGQSSIKVRAQNGVIMGISANISVTETSSEDIFTDVAASHVNATAIKYLKDNNIIGGYADGSFKPNKEVTRIEAVKMLILGLNKGLSPAEQLKFPDTNNAEWYAPYVGRALSLAMVKGYPDGTFKPNNQVNRAEYYTILIRAAIGSVPTATSAPFDDVEAGNWFSDYIAYAKDHTITDAQSKFFPSGNVTRAEVAETLYRILMQK